MQDQSKPDELTANNQSIIQLIVFRAGNEEFGVRIDSVREIIKIGTITPIPESSDFIKGIINVRGEIVTTIDIKSRFSLPDAEGVEPKHIVVTKQDDSLFGLIVDEVTEVLRIREKDIKPPPSLITKINEKYVSGIVSHDDRLIILLELNLILSKKELTQLSNINKMKLNEEKRKSKKKLKKSETSDVNLSGVISKKSNPGIFNKE